MLRVVSVSLGSSRRNGAAEVRVGGERLLLQRVGVDGDWRRAAALLRHLDGRVAAIGLGGVNDAYWVGDRCYGIPRAARLRRCLRRTPCADGTAWKRWAEPLLLRRLADEEWLPPRGVAVVTSVLDRWWLAETLAGCGLEVRAGDPWFALGVPWLPRLAAFRCAATLSLPVLRFLPLGWLYPHRDARVLRSEEEPPRSGLLRPSAGAFPQRRSGDTRGIRPPGPLLWAGDVRLLLRRLPPLLPGDRILAAHAPPEEAGALAAQGAAVASLNPVVDGFAPAANLWEAAVLALTGSGVAEPPLVRAVAAEVAAQVPRPRGSGRCPGGRGGRRAR